MERVSGRGPSHHCARHCQSDAQSHFVPISAPCFDAVTQLTSQMDRAAFSWCQLWWVSRYRGPPHKVSPTPLATSFPSAARSLRASHVCEHQNNLKLLSAGNPGVCDFRGLNRLMGVSKSSTASAKKG